MKRSAKAHWEGDLKEGKGQLTTQSGILHHVNYNFKTRTSDGETGTNPEELLAAAHAGCFTMAVSAALTQQGRKPTALDTEATVTMEGLSITSVHLSISGVVPGIDAAAFENITKDAEKNCIISKALRVTITSEAKLVTGVE